MSTREEIISGFYNQVDEDSRLQNNRHGQLEYAVTMHYIHRFAAPGSKVLEVGAGTGRYSIALAKEGMNVTAVELVEKNLDVLKQNSRGVDHISSFQGDATDLGRFEDEAFDVTLVFGPLYHLYDAAEIHKAIDEAIRVTKKDGVILFAFLSVFGIMYANYLSGDWAEGQEENFTKDYKVKQVQKAKRRVDISEITPKDDEGNEMDPDAALTIAAKDYDPFTPDEEQVETEKVEQLHLSLTLMTETFLLHNSAKKINDRKKHIFQLLYSSRLINFAKDIHIPKKGLQHEREFMDCSNQKFFVFCYDSDRQIYVSFKELEQTPLKTNKTVYQLAESCGKHYKRCP